MLVKVIVMVLGDREYASHYQSNDYGLQKLH